MMRSPAFTLWRGKTELLARFGEQLLQCYEETCHDAFSLMNCSSLAFLRFPGSQSLCACFSEAALLVVGEEGYYGLVGLGSG